MDRLVKGSGALISANLVITAAHVVIDRKHNGKPYKSMRFHPAVQGQLVEIEGIIA